MSQRGNYQEAIRKLKSLYLDLKILKMKTLLFALLLSFTASAQTQYDYLGGFTLDPAQFPNNCFYFDVDNDMQHDLSIIYGNGSVRAESFNDDSVKFSTYEDMWLDCDRADLYESTVAHIIKPNETLEYRSHVLPFVKNGVYGYFVIRVFYNYAVLRGHVLEAGTKETFECFDLEGLDNLEVEYTDYDLMGIPAESGLLIRKYADGPSEKIYR